MESEDLHIRKFSKLVYLLPALAIAGGAAYYYVLHTSKHDMSNEISPSERWIIKDQRRLEQLIRQADAGGDAVYALRGHYLFSNDGEMDTYYYLKIAVKDDYSTTKVVDELLINDDQGTSATPGLNSALQHAKSKNDLATMQYGEKVRIQLMRQVESEE